MRKPMRANLALFAALTALLVAGCTDTGSPGKPAPTAADDQFEDADVRVAKEVAGGEQNVDHIEVPANAPKLIVKARYSGNAGAHFQLQDPSGRVVKQSSISSAQSQGPITWYQTSQPAAGTWTFDAFVGGNMEYAFGFYFHDVDVAPVVKTTAGVAGAQAGQPQQPETAVVDEASKEGWVYAGAAVGAGALALGAVALTEVGRYKLLKLGLLLPLFSRFEKDEVLENERRDQLYQMIRDQPGRSFSDLQRSLEVGNGTLAHHLRILERQEFIKPMRDGFRTRFYVRGPKVVPEAYLTRTQERFLDEVRTRPGLTQKELSTILGLPRESIFYHATRLESMGRLRVSKDGRWRRYFLAQPPGQAYGMAKVETPTTVL